MDGNSSANANGVNTKKKQESNPIESAIEADPTFQYVISTCQEKECRDVNWESGKRKMLKQQCIRFLEKIGHSN